MFWPGKNICIFLLSGPSIVYYLILDEKRCVFGDANVDYKFKVGLFVALEDDLNPLVFFKCLIKEKTWK